MTLETAASTLAVWRRFAALQLQARLRPAALFNLGEWERTVQDGDPVVLLVPPEQLLVAWHHLRPKASAGVFAFCPTWERAQALWPTTSQRTWCSAALETPLERQTVVWHPWTPEAVLPLEAWKASGVWIFPLWASVRDVTLEEQRWPRWTERLSIFVEEQGIQVGSGTAEAFRKTLEERFRRLQQGAERV